MVWKLGRIIIIIIYYVICNVVNAEDLFFENINFANSTSKQNFVKETLPLSLKEQAIINYNKGVELLKNSQEVEAAILFKKVLDVLPKYHKARLQLVQLYNNIGWFDEVEKLLQIGLDLAPQHEDFIKHLAVIYNQKSHARKALAILLTMPQHGTQQVDYLALLALTYLHADQADMAEKHYRQLLEFNKENAIWWLGLAVAEDASCKYKNALESFNKAKDLGRFNSETLEYINNKLEQIKKYY